MILCSQLFGVKTWDLLTQVIMSHHSTIQYCDFCPDDELVAVALSHCSVEVSDCLCYSMPGKATCNINVTFVLIVSCM